MKQTERGLWEYDYVIDHTEVLEVHESLRQVKPKRHEIKEMVQELVGHFDVGVTPVIELSRRGRGQSGHYYYDGNRILLPQDPSWQLFAHEFAHHLHWWKYLSPQAREHVKYRKRPRPHGIEFVWAIDDVVKEIRRLA